MNFEVNSVDTSSFSMKYIKFGSGEKIYAVIPGISVKSITESAGAVCQAFSLFHNDYTVYVFDRAENIGAGCTIKDMADDTAEAMKQLGLKDIYLFGASQGGMIAQYIAIYYPSLIKKAVFGSTMPENNENSTKIINEWLEAAGEYDRVKLNRLFFRYVYSDEFLETYKAALSLLEQQGTKDELRKFYHLAKSCLEFNSVNELNKIKCPVLVIGSEKDKIFGGDLSRKLAKLCGGECYIYDGYSHAVYDEAPDYRTRIKEFFERGN